VALGGLAALAASRAPVSDSDLFWHLAVGRDVAAHGIARVDTYSWTVAGRSVGADQWLGEVLEYAAYAVGSWRGIVALRALAVGVFVGVVAWTALAERPRRPLIAVVAALPALALSRFTWTDRPELLGLVAFAVLLAMLRAGGRGGFWPLALCAPLLLLWANLHGSYALGLGLVLLVALERAVVDPRRRRRYAALALACALATLVTPTGLGTWTSSGGHFLAPPRFVQEETTPDVATLPGALFAATLLATLVTALLIRRRRGTEVLFELTLLIPVAFVSLTAARHLVFFAIAAAPYLARCGPEAVAALRDALLGGWLALGSSRSAAKQPRQVATLSTGTTGERGGHGGPSRVADAIAGALACALLIGAVLTAPSEPDLSGFPVAALSALPAGPGALNRYEWGGFLIWYAPATPVFVDGRLFPYVGEALDDYRAVIGLHANWRDVLTRRGIRTLLVAPSDAIAVRARDLGWPMLISTEKFTLVRVP
jgi:hypothetical protein